MDGSSFFVLTKIKTERMNRMKNKPNLWNSVSVLVVAVLIVTAFIRGMAQIWLYAAVFAAWAVWVTYAGSIESNLMQMVLAKEKINLFMKGQDTDLNAIYEKFGVDYDLFSLLMHREEDAEGRFHIRWGEQQIA